SSFGFGGASAHVVVEEWSHEQEAVSGELEPALVVASARTPEALRAWVETFAKWLDAHPEAAVADIAFTLRRGRDEMDARAAWVARDLAELRRAVEAWLAGDVELKSP